MEKVEKKIPVLRFPEFVEEWKKIKLSELSDKISDGIHATPKYDDNGNYYFINGNNLINGSIVVDKKTKRVNETEFKKHKRLLGKETILLSINGTIGNLAIYKNEKVVLGKSASYINLKKDTNKEFVFNILKTPSIQNFFNTELTGSTIKNLSLTTIKNTIIKLPSLPEQQKIASFLTAVDNKIQQLTKKKSLLEQYKKGVMQKIFKQEIRFKDDDGNDFPEWEVIRGKHLFKSHSNKSHNGDLPILAATQDRGMVYRDSIGIKIQSSEASVKSYKIVDKGDFVISLRSFQGGIEYSDVKGICSPAYIILKPKVQINEYFFRIYFKKEDFITRLSKTVVGIRDGKQISYDAFSGLKLPYPCFNEQRKIADFLTSIDNKIDLANTQLKKTQAFKKGLLQQMFV